MSVYVDIYMGVYLLSACGDQKTTSGITPQEPLIQLVLSDTASSAGQGVPGPCLSLSSQY